MPLIQCSVLLPHGLIEAEGRNELVAAELVGGDVVLGEHQVDDAARNEAHRREHNEARKEQRRNQRQKAAHDIGLHRPLSAGGFHSLVQQQTPKFGPTQPLSDNRTV
jgi:hypothetical protein